MAMHFRFLQESKLGSQWSDPSFYSNIKQVKAYLCDPLWESSVKMWKINTFSQKLGTLAHKLYKMDAADLIFPNSVVP